MGIFDTKKEMPEVAACEKELGMLGQRRNEVYLEIGQQYASEMTVAMAKGTAYEEKLQELMKIADRSILLEKRMLAVQDLRKCEKCGNILSLDSAFCNKCGVALQPLAPEVMTDGPLCPQCKEPVEVGVSFCTKCGAKLSEAEATPVYKPAVRKCDACGMECEPGTVFCTNCGKKLEG